MNFGIIGIGCIGSSLAREIKHHKLGPLFLCDANQSYLDQAKTLNIGDFYTESLSEIAANCDIIFVCTPIRTISKILLNLLPNLKDGTIITDVGSVKGAIYQDIRASLRPEIHYIPGHPITAGTTESGPTAGKLDNFRDKKYILTPLANSCEAALSDLKDILQKFGADIDLMALKTHDQLLGFTSHLSHLIAFSVVQGAEQISQSVYSNILNYAGGSFRDLTRVAAADSQMWLDIFLSNKEELKPVLNLFRSQLTELEKLIENEDEEKLLNFLETAKTLKQTKFT